MEQMELGQESEGPSGLEILPAELVEKAKLVVTRALEALAKNPEMDVAIAVNQQRVPIGVSISDWEKINKAAIARVEEQRQALQI